MSGQRDINERNLLTSNNLSNLHFENIYDQDTLNFEVDNEEELFQQFLNRKINQINSFLSNVEQLKKLSIYHKQK